ncbi:MAG: radical SAM family heme chaperone HemW [Candidatus Dormibacteria bacterium]
MLALYVHVPFCERRCEYCDFASVAGTARQEEYVAVLRDEIGRAGAALCRPRLDSVFCGGGTPGLLDLDLLDSVMETVRGAFRLDDDVEATLEVNPSSTTVERARRWRGAGFNRVSVGVQSTHDDILSSLGRIHDGGRAIAALGEVREAGFANVSADLIYAVPGLDDDRFADTLDRVIAAAPDHVSCYELTVEEGTPLHRAVAAGRRPPVDPERALAQHAIAVRRLGAAGYAQYEVSNFSRPRRECAHNLVYWRNGWWAACGVGAHGHLPAAVAAGFGLRPPPGAVAFRTAHARSLSAYLRDPGVAVEWVDATVRTEETLMLGLRLREGTVLPPAARAEAAALVAAGLLQERGERVAVTARGEEVLNAVTVRIAQAAASVGQRRRP